MLSRSSSLCSFDTLRLKPVLFLVAHPSFKLILCATTSTLNMAKEKLDVGIVGAGIGGVMAAIAIAHVGGKATVLEAAEQLGEIGAGIQMVCSIPDPLEDIHSLRCRHQMWRDS